MNKTLLRTFCILVIAVFFACTTETENQSGQFSDADTLIENALRNDLFTGAVLLIGNSDEILHHKAFGFATLYDENLKVVAEPDSMSTSHLFDIASLTKIFATTYGVMALHSDEQIDINDPVSGYLAEFDSEKHKGITIRNLLSHTSGLAQWYPTYYEAENSAANRKLIAELPLLNQPGENRRYSDLGFMLLAEIIEQVTNMKIEAYLDNRIYSRLGLSNTQYAPSISSNVDYVSTSHGNPFEKKMVYEPGFGYNIDIEPTLWDNWRTYTLNGEVNDGNAHYTYGGIAGHAGLFSTAEELYALLKLILNDGMHNGSLIFTPETIDLFIGEGQFENGLGWGISSSTTHASARITNVVGHTGFTGTNFLLSRDQKKIYILLTNRQHVGINESGNYPNLRELREELSGIIF